jgi:hypothetical protein
MALLAEEIVEEWLNRNGFFTIRGIKIGVHEIDLLAIGFRNGDIHCRHVEVQASVRPVSYVTALPKEIQKSTGRGPANARARTLLEVQGGVDEWVEKKFQLPAKHSLRQSLFRGAWSFELVVHRVKFEEELQEIEKRGIMIHRLDDIIAEMSRPASIITSASGSELLELVLLGKNKEPIPVDPKNA